MSEPRRISTKELAEGLDIIASVQPDDLMGAAARMSAARLREQQAEPERAELAVLRRDKSLLDALEAAGTRWELEYTNWQNGWRVWVGNHWSGGWACVDHKPLREAIAAAMEMKGGDQ